MTVRRERHKRAFQYAEVPSVSAIWDSARSMGVASSGPYEAAVVTFMALAPVDAVPTVRIDHGTLARGLFGPSRKRVLIAAFSIRVALTQSGEVIKFLCSRASLASLLGSELEAAEANRVRTSWTIRIAASR